MYVKQSIGAILVLTGIVASSPTRPAARVARILLEITGAGFVLYCLVAMGLLLAARRLRGRAGAARRNGLEDR